MYVSHETCFENTCGDGICKCLSLCAFVCLRVNVHKLTGIHLAKLWEWNTTAFPRNKNIVCRVGGFQRALLGVLWKKDPGNEGSREAGGFISERAERGGGGGTEEKQQWDKSSVCKQGECMMEL